MARRRRARDIEDQLRQAIVGSGMSRYRLSKVTGVSDGVLSNFVNGHRSVTLTTAVKLCKALKLELRPVQER